MRTYFLPASAAGIMALSLAGAAWADAVPRVAQSRAFFEALEFGETVEIVRNGPISIEAKCEESIPDPFNPERLVDRIRLLATTTAPGVAGQGIGNFIDPDTPENARGMFFLSAFPPGDPEYSNDTFAGTPGSLAAPSGEVIPIDGDTLGLGVNVFGVDCLVAGTYNVFDGRF
jgi:hypothetical protein